MSKAARWRCPRTPRQASSASGFATGGAVRSGRSATDPSLLRVQDLQPYQGEAPDDHPLRLLVDYTNRAKHRIPAVATTRPGLVLPDASAPGLFVSATGARLCPYSRAAARMFPDAVSAARQRR